MPTDTYGADLFSLTKGKAVGKYTELAAYAGAYARANVNTRRGFNFNASLGAQGGGSASAHKFVAATLNAAAKLRLELLAQAQFPLDLFNECGAVCRLSAAAEAGVYGSLSIGMALEDFRRAFVKDQSGIALRMGEIFLDEVLVEGGVWAKAAVTAQAMVNCTVAGSLLPDPRTARVPGFVASFDWGLGFLYGTGMAFFARIGFRDPARLISRTADELTAIVLELVEKGGGRSAKATVPYARMLVPIAIRASYELGVLSTHASGAAARTKAREALTEIVRAEAANFAAELLVATALVRMRKLMEDPNVAKAASALTADKATAARKALEDFQAALPKRPSLTTVPRLIGPFLEFVGIVAPPEREAFTEAAATLWAALAVLASAREGGKTGSAQIAQPGDLVLRHIRKTVQAHPQLRPVATAPAALAAQYLIAAGGLDKAVATVPEASDAVAWLRSVFPGTDLATALFNSTRQGLTDQGWSALKNALRKVARDKLEGEVAELVTRAGGDQQVKEFTEGIVRPAVLSLGEVVLERVDDLGSAEGRLTFREQVSLLLVQIIGRNVVYCGDILLARALSEAARGMRALAGDLRGNGRSPFLKFANDAMKLSPLGSPKDKLIEILEFGAGLAELWDDKERGKLRASLLDMMDLLGTRRGGDAGVWQKVAKDKKYLPNLKQVKAFIKMTLAQLGRLVMRAVLLFFQQLLTEIKELVKKVGKALLAAARSWLKVMDAAVRQLQAAVRKIVNTVRTIAKQIASFVSNIKKHIKAFTQRLRSKQFRDHALRELRNIAEKGVLAVLHKYGPFKIIPKFLRKGADGVAKTAFRGAFDVTLRPVLAAALDGVIAIASVVPQGVADPEALSAQLETAGRTHDDAIRRAFTKVKGVGISFKIAKKRIRLTIPVPTASLVSALSRLISADQVVRRALEGNKGLQRQIGGLRQQQQRHEAQQRTEEQKLRQAQQRVGQTKTGALTVNIASPKVGEVYSRSAAIDAVIRGGNAALIDPPAGGKPRVEVVLDGKAIGFRRQDWSVKGNELHFKHTIKPAGSASRTVSVLVTDGRKQQAAASAAFGLVA